MTLIMLPRTANKKIVAAKNDGVVDWDKVVEEKVVVDRKHYKFFFQRRGQPIRKISEENGRVNISFPPIGSTSNKVVLKGARKFVNTAKFAIMEIVSDIESRVVIECIIPRKHHAAIIGFQGVNVQKLVKDYGVFIHFPDRGIENQASASQGTINPYDVISIKGRKENCLSVKQALLDLVPFDISVGVSFRYHRAIIGERSENIRYMCDRYGVWINIPPLDQEKDRVYLHGPLRNCEDAKEALLTFVNQLQDEDKKPWSRHETVQFSPNCDIVPFDITVEVPFRFHRAIFGQRGENIPSLCDQHGVRIKIPPSVLEKDCVYIQGKASGCEKAEEALVKRVEELQKEGEGGELGSPRETVRVASEQLPVDHQLPDPVSKCDVAKETLLKPVTRSQNEAQDGEPRSHRETVPASHEYHQLPGPVSKCDDAKEALLKPVQRSQDEAQEGELQEPPLKPVKTLQTEAQVEEVRSRRETVPVFPKHHQPVVSKRGKGKKPMPKSVKELQDEAEDRQHWSRREDQYLKGSLKGQSSKMRTFYTVDEEDVSVLLDIDHRVFASLIGVRAKTITRVKRQFRVAIHFPWENGTNKVTITGKKKDVEDAKEYVLVLEDFFLEDVLEREAKEHLHRQSTPADTNGQDRPEGDQEAQDTNSS